MPVFNVFASLVYVDMMYYGPWYPGNGKYTTSNYNVHAKAVSVHRTTHYHNYVMLNYTTLSISNSPGGTTVVNPNIVVFNSKIVLLNFSTLLRRESGC